MTTNMTTATTIMTETDIKNTITTMTMTMKITTTKYSTPGKSPYIWFEYDYD